MSALDKYDEFVERRWFTSDADEGQANRDMAIAALGLNGEAGEVAEKVKKWLRGDAMDLFELQRTTGRELGDVLFYLTKLAHLLGLTLDDIAQANVDKLTDREARGVTRGNGDDR